MRPDFSRERAHGGRVAGVDEAGRGPLAGPVVAAAVVFPHGVPAGLEALLDDSKKLTAAAREAALLALLACGMAEIGVGAASVTEILRLNILHASMLAMRRAVLRLPGLPDLALIDGNRAPALPCPAQCCIGGDARAMPGVVAVVRDGRFLGVVAKREEQAVKARLALRHPAYGWHANAGYGTAAHRAALHRHGPCAHHRAAFGTVRLLGRAAAIPGAAD